MTTEQAQDKLASYIRSTKLCLISGSVFAFVGDVRMVLCPLTVLVESPKGSTTVPLNKELRELFTSLSKNCSSDLSFLPRQSENANKG